MARKKTTTVVTDLPDTNEEGNGSDVATIEDPLAEILALYPNANRKIRVTRYTPAGLEFVCSTNEMIDEEFLQDIHGAGRYLVKVFIDGVKKLEYEMRIAAKAGTRGPSNGKSTPAGDPSIAPQSENDFLKSLVLGLIAKKSEATEQTATPVGELAQAMKTVHEMTGGADSSKQYTDGLKAGIELGKGMSGNGSGDWKAEAFKMLKETLPAIANAFPQANRGLAQPALPAATPQSNAAGSADAVLYDGLQRLKQQCLNQVPAGLVIDWALANANDTTVQHFVRAALTRDLPAFAAIDPEIGNEPFATWFAEIHDGLRSAFKAADDVSDDRAGEARNG